MRRRIWPQKVRTRLALLYATLFLVSGSALLALTYGLVAASLPQQSPAAASGLDSNQLAKLRVACRQPYPDPGTVLACKRAFSAGADSVRDSALNSLLIFSLLGRVPKRGEFIPHPAGIEFEVLDADPRRVKKLRVHLPQGLSHGGGSAA